MLLPVHRLASDKRSRSTKFTVLVHCVTPNCAKPNSSSDQLNSCPNLLSTAELEQEVNTSAELILHRQKLSSLETLTRAVAHDFGNLLHTIIGNASIAALELPAQSTAKQCLGQIAKAALFASDLSKQLIACSERIGPKKQTIALDQIVREMVPLLNAVISKEAKLLINTVDKSSSIEAYPAQIRQIILNLVLNASDALCGHQGIIRITTGKTFTPLSPADPVRAFIEITDTGSGMPEEVQKRIFDPRFSTKAKDRGLGLSGVRELLSGLEGTINVQSTINVGTTFIVTFPLNNPSENGGENGCKLQQLN